MKILAVAVMLVASVVDWPVVVVPLEKQVVRLEMKQAGQEGTGVCSGSVIDLKRGYILTAAHCVPEEKDGAFTITANKREATVEKVDTNLDLAILSFYPYDEQEIALGTATPPAGTEVAMAGFAFGVKGLVTNFGRISRQVTDEGYGVWVDGNLIFGMSGGPAIDSRGRLIGVNSAIYSRGPAHLAQAVKIEYVRAFVIGYLPVPVKRSVR